MDTIKSVRFSKDGKFSPVEVYGTINGKEVKIFEFFDDEINFSEDEIVGLTYQEAVDLKFKRDKEYIMS